MTTYWYNSTTSAGSTYYYNNSNSTTTASDTGTHIDWYRWTRRNPYRIYKYVITPARFVRKSQKPIEFLTKLTNSFRRLRNIFDKLDLCLYCGDIHNKKNMKRRQCEGIYICDKCYDESNFETCVICGFIDFREKLNWDIHTGEYLCSECYTHRCATCGCSLHNQKAFPDDFPEKFKFCCACHTLLGYIILGKDIAKSPVNYKRVKRLKEICFGTIDVWEKNPLIS